LKPRWRSFRATAKAQLLIGGGVNMVPAAKPLDLRRKPAPLREAAKAGRCLGAHPAPPATL